MKFSSSIIATALVSSANGFTTSRFSRGVQTSTPTDASPQQHTDQHTTRCSCGSCRQSPFAMVLKMSDTAVEEAIPADVEAMDGINSEEEAHNVERPARGSGIHKHHKDDKKSRTALGDLEIGAEVKATVKTIASYGAFIDIGAASDALLHVSRLSDDFVANVEDVVKKGDEISVRIVSVDTEKNQIAVTMRSPEAEAKAAEGGSTGRPQRRRERPQRSNGDKAAQAASINALVEKGFDEEKFVEGEVVSSLDFGAFVRFDTAQVGEGFEGEVDGLVHISALAEGRVNTVSDVVAIGDKVQVRIRTVDAEAGRVSLSMITKEQEEASRPPRREKNNDRGNFSAVANSWKDTGAADWKEQLEEFGKDQPGFTNTAVVVERL